MNWWSSLPSRLKVATVALAATLVAVIGLLALQRQQADDSAAPARDRATATPTPDVKPVSKALDLGTDAKISSNYRVAITDATLYEGQSDQYLVATVEATYIGKKDGDPWADLILQFSKPHSQALDESSCPDDVRESNASEPPPMAKGDVATYAVCFDLPSSEIGDGRVSVEEAYAKGHPAAWSTADAVTKALPSPAPRPTAAQNAPAQPQTQARQNTDSSDRYDSSDVEEYRDDLDEAISKYKKQRDAIDAQIRAYKKQGYSDDDLDDYYDWRDKVDDAIDYYEKQRDKLG